MIKIENRQVTSTEGRLVRRVGSDVYFRRATVLDTDTEVDFEEVDSRPAYSLADYEARVAELIAERYTTAQELALINNYNAGECAEEYAFYQSFRAECKAKARQELESAKSKSDNDSEL